MFEAMSIVFFLLSCCRFRRIKLNILVFVSEIHHQMEGTTPLTVAVVLVYSRALSAYCLH